MNLELPVSDLFLVGPAYARRLKRLGVGTVSDLLYYFPFRYEDYSLISAIAKIQPGETVTVRGTVSEIKNEYTRQRKIIQKAIVSDKSGDLTAVWFNQPFLTRIMKKGGHVSLSGKIDDWNNQPAMISPEYEIIKRNTPTRHTGRLVPIYHETTGLSSKWLRSRIANILEDPELVLEELLPSEVVAQNKLMPFAKAIREIHFPTNQTMAEETRHRFAFEELFLTQLTAINHRLKRERAKPLRPMVNQPESLKAFIDSLPFKLTGAQERCLGEITADLTGNKPMNRLLQGDVGSGKTIVAAVAIYLSHLNGFQSALMAPTEILANQHFQTLKELLSPRGLRVQLLTGSQKKTPEEFDLVVGTHALIHRKIPFSRLGLVVIDEQQRFGVTQRASLLKEKSLPHFLTMTATPIPRTIALTLYGDLDLSIIDEMPKNRQPVKTWIVPNQKKESAYDWIQKQIQEKGIQVFIVCPLIEESETETMKDVRAATKEFERLQKRFSSLKVGLLHGRLKSKEKQDTIETFRKQALDILVATPVVEVGIDMPGATIMVIEAGERFGLSQLHQLRGRVGRRGQQAYCLVFTSDPNQENYRRLKILEKTNLGSKLAEEDLRLRGPGEVYGTRQHGFDSLKIASFSDLGTIEKARKAAIAVANQSPGLNKFPPLKAKLEKAKIRSVSAD